VSGPLPDIISFSKETSLHSNGKAADLYTRYAIVNTYPF